MRRTEEAGYREFVVGRLDGWRRTAYLVCRDWHAADDLVSTVVERLYLKWRRISEVANPDGYVRGMLVRAWLDELRRPWRRELSVAVVHDVAVDTGATRVDDRLAMADLLTELGPAKRAVLVLRFYSDLSVADTAELLGVTEGTVKSQTARALAELRRHLPAHLQLGVEA